MKRSAAKSTFSTLVLVGVAALALVGCGGSSNGELDQFLGTWVYELSSGSVTCTAGQAGTFDLNGVHKLLESGATSDLVDLSNCDYKYDVKGKVATLQA